MTYRATPGQGLKIGDKLRVRLTRDLDPAQVELPATVTKLLACNKVLRVVIDKDAHPVWGGCELKLRDQCKRVWDNETGFY